MCIRDSPYPYGLTLSACGWQLQKLKLLCCYVQLEEEETPGTVRLSKFLPLMTQVLLERRSDLHSFLCPYFWLLVLTMATKEETRSLSYLGWKFGNVTVTSLPPRLVDMLMLGLAAVRCGDMLLLMLLKTKMMMMMTFNYWSTNFYCIVLYCIV